MLAYLSMMARGSSSSPRAEAHRLLYLHCDPTASHYLKLLLDSVFGPTTSATHLEADALFGQQQGGGTAVTSMHDFPVPCEGRKKTKWSRRNRHQKKDEAVQPGVPRAVQVGRQRRPRPGVPQGGGGGGGGGTLLKTFKSEATFDRLKADDRPIGAPVKRGGGEGRDGRIQYLSESSGVHWMMSWTDVNAINPAAKERLGYPTQKPEGQPRTGASSRPARTRVMLSSTRSVAVARASLPLNDSSADGSASTSRTLPSTSSGTDFDDTYGDKIASTYRVIGESVSRWMRRRSWRRRSVPVSVGRSASWARGLLEGKKGPTKESTAGSSSTTKREEERARIIL